MPTKIVILVDRMITTHEGLTKTMMTTSMGAVKNLSEAYDRIEEEINNIKANRISIATYRRCNIKSIRFRITKMEYPNWPSLDDVIIRELTNEESKD